MSDTKFDRLKRDLSMAMINRDPDGVARAVGALACEAGPSSLAKATGLSREGFHHLQRRGGNPRISTLFKALKELDIGIRTTEA
jgi:probable addiction module antidote protein